MTTNSVLKQRERRASGDGIFAERVLLPQILGHNRIQTDVRIQRFVDRRTSERTVEPGELLLLSSPILPEEKSNSQSRLKLSHFNKNLSMTNRGRLKR